MQIDQQHMQRAIELAELGRGTVEPNPVVGCVIASGERILAEGHHQRFGGPHAEINALAALDDVALPDDATMYVTLEPCCHYGKTPPCTDAIIAAGIRRVVMAMQDPDPLVDGGGKRQLGEAGIEVVEGVLEGSAARQNAPAVKLVTKHQPWVIAKWAMTLDGKIATSANESRWISTDASREVVHALRGRVDAIIVGRNTARHDDPQLTARPPGPRVATRIVVDSSAQTALNSQLVRATGTAPVLIAVGPDADQDRCLALAAAGCEVWQGKQSDANRRLVELLDDLGQRQMMNVLIEGGGALLGSLFDLRQIDEAHVFISSKLIGGERALTPIGGEGVIQMSAAARLDRPKFEIIDGDVYIHGPLRWPSRNQRR
jgi:diaminohydroxyphosphoribosylaminopyrimidine deaminase/5-amino-6-(5-phosphoribosylamino)uracil reductase